MWNCVCEHEWGAGPYLWRWTLHISLHLGVGVLPQTLQNYNINLHLSDCCFIANTPKLQYLVIYFFRTYTSCRKELWMSCACPRRPDPQLLYAYPFSAWTSSSRSRKWSLQERSVYEEVPLDGVASSPVGVKELTHDGSGKCNKNVGNCKGNVFL